MPKRLLPLFQRLLFFSLVMTFINFSYTISQPFQLPKAAGFTFFGFLFLAVSAFLPGKKTFFTPLSVSFFLFFLWVSFKTLFSPYAPEPYYAAAIVSCAAFLFPSLAKIDPLRFIYFISALVFTSCIIAFSQLFSGILRPYSFFGNPIFFAEFLLILFPPLAAAFFAYEKNRPWFFITLTLSLACMFLSGSRGVIIALVFSSAMFLYLIFKSGASKLPPVKNRALYAVSFGILFMCFILTPAVNDSLSNFSSRAADSFESASSSTANRALLAKVSAEIIRDLPAAGAGAGGFSRLYQRYQAGILKENSGFRFVFASYAHNDYLQLAAETGIIGLVLFLLFMFALFAVFDRAGASLDNSVYILCCGFLCAAAGFFIESFFNFPLFILPSAALFWLTCGFIFHLLPPGKTPAMSSGFTAIFVLTVFTAVSSGMPSGFISGAFLAPGSGKSPAVKNNIDMAIKYSPKNFTAYSALASSLVISSDYTASLKAFEKALELRPYSADMLYNAGSINMKLKNYTAAESYFRESLSLYPGFAQAHLGLAKTLVELKRGAEASAEFSSAVKYDSSITDFDFKESVIDFREVE